MDIFKFPFLSEVWGTVSDWVMIIVTGVTAYLLYKTLNAQKEVQLVQNRFLEIEQIRIRQDFKPDLKYSRLEDQYSTTRGKYCVAIAVRNISDNNALNVRPIYQKNFDYVSLEPYEAFPQNLVKNGDFLRLYFVIDLKKVETFSYFFFNFEVVYENIAGTRYKQDVLCWQKPDSTELIKPSIPEIIS